METFIRRWARLFLIIIVLLCAADVFAYPDFSNGDFIIRPLIELNFPDANPAIQNISLEKIGLIFGLKHIPQPFIMDNFRIKAAYLFYLEENTEKGGFSSDKLKITPGNLLNLGFSAGQYFDDIVNLTITMDYLTDLSPEPVLGHAFEFSPRFSVDTLDNHAYPTEGLLYRMLIKGGKWRDDYYCIFDSKTNVYMDFFWNIIFSLELGMQSFLTENIPVEKSLLFYYPGLNEYYCDSSFHFLLSLKRKIGSISIKLPINLMGHSFLFLEPGIALNYFNGIYSYSENNNFVASSLDNHVGEIMLFVNCRAGNKESRVSSSMFSFNLSLLISKDTITDLMSMIKISFRSTVNYRDSIYEDFYY